jgi:hypothetical protein
MRSVEQVFYDSAGTCSWSKAEEVRRPQPLAQLMMFLFFTISAVYMICIRALGEGLGLGSWAYVRLGDLCRGRGSQQVHSWLHGPW